MPHSMPKNQSLIGIQHRLGRFFSKDQDEAENPSVSQVEANIQMTGDYSSTEEIFYIKPPSTLIYEIHRVLILIRDNSVITSDDYIGTGALTNGVNFMIENGGSILANTLPIKQISDYGSYAGVDVKALDNNSPKAWAIRWSLDKAGAPLYLQGSKNERLNVHLNDKFDTLTSHTALIQGMIWDA